MKRLQYLVVIVLGVGGLAQAVPLHKRDGSNLPRRDQEFASLLSIKQRKIFCGRFNQKQRGLAVKYARGRGQDTCLTPDESVIKVMEDTGMSLAFKGRFSKQGR